MYNLIKMFFSDVSLMQPDPSVMWDGGGEDVKETEAMVN